MAKSTRVFGFNEDGFRRAREAINRQNSTPYRGSGNRRQPPVLSGTGGSGGEVIAFEIIDTATIYDTATILGAYCQVMVCRVIGVSCGLSSPQVGDEVYVWDSHQCRFDIAFELLDGAKGYATRMTTLEDYETNDQDGGLDSERPCRWEVTSLCCVEETNTGSE